MRTNNWILLAVLVSGCSYGAATSGNRGQTMREHAGAVSMVFTNASPETVCTLRLSFEGQAKHGDNWLPAEGLPSGKSVAFKVKPGKYKATWNTCTSSDKPYYAATLVGDWAFEVKDATQLFAYVADTVAPTKRAAPKDFHKLVKFPGQMITPGTGTAVAQRDSMSMKQDEPVASNVNPNDPNARAAQPATKFDAADWVERPKQKSSKRAAKIKPSLDRSVEVGTAKAKYAGR